MITLNHINIYRKYNGDGDGFIRCATSEEKAVMDYKHWSLIASLVQDIFFIKKGLASDAFVKMTYEKLNNSCEGEETIAQLQKLVM